MKQLFFDDKGQIRSGWRAVTFLFSFLLIAYGLIFLSLVVLSQIQQTESVTGYLPLLIPFTISSVIAILLGWLFAKLFENLPFRVLGISFRGNWFRNLLAGLAVGGIAIGSAVLIAVMSGGMSLTLNRDSSGSAITTTLAVTLVIFIAGAVSEETLFRGYLLQTFARSNLVVVGIGFTSLLFAFAHNANPDAGRLSLLNTFLAGIWFALAYLKTRDLWFPLGLHLMWNWLQGPVFGINVSGIAQFSPDPLLRATDAGPVWLTGGSYGIEGGIVCTIAIVISMGLIYFLPISATETTESIEVRTQ